MSKISYYKREALPLEMHKVCIVQKTSILPVEERVKAIRRAGLTTAIWICLPTAELMP